MERVEYRVNENVKDNRIGLSIKYPEDINRKWSESDVSIQCSECGGKNLDTDLTGDMLTITCLDCSNFWQGPVDEILGWRDTEEAYATVFSLDNFEKVPREDRENAV